MTFVSTFLSHSSADSDLVAEVSKSLGRRGVLTWLDQNELREMGPLDQVLKDAVQQQTTLTIFLSEASLKSEWCKDELRWALEAKEGCDHILPVYLGDPLKLVRAHDLLNKRFLHGDGDRVNQLGAACEQDADNPDADAIATKIAATAYKRSIPKNWSDLVIVLDQRGDGQRRGKPYLPENIIRLNSPTLTFRPNPGQRQKREVLKGDEWKDMAKAMSQTLSNSLGTLRGDPRKVRVFGYSQTGLMWMIGQHFDRTTVAKLYAYGSNGIPVSNKDQDRHTSLTGGNLNSANLVTGTLTPNKNYSTVALGVGIEEKFVSYVQQAVPDIPLVWIEPGFINDSQEAMQLVADIVASVEHLRRDHGLRELVLFWTTANHVALLAAANLTSHVVPTIRFMEWDHACAEYVELPMP